MSIPTIPKVLHPIKFADQGVSFSGYIALNQLPRVMDMQVAQENLQVERVNNESVANSTEALGSDEAKSAPFVSLSFSKDEQNLRVVSGQLQGNLRVECQRCLMPTNQAVEADFQLAVVLTDEQARHLPKYYEPLLVENDEVDLYQLVEEELLLSMPMFSYHADENCSGWKNSDLEFEEAGVKDDFEIALEEKKNPFEILKQLKKT